MISGFSILVSAPQAHAACTSPAGVAAEIVYNSSESVLQYCDGSQWIAMGPVTPGPGGDCTNPAAAPGTVVYNADYDVPQFCNGGEWVAMGPVPGAGGAGCTSPSGPPGAMIFNNDAGRMQYCDGTDWIALRGYHSGAVNTCDDPDAFDFTDDSSAPLNTADHPSDIVQVTGSFTCTVNVAVDGHASAEFRICNDGTCSGAPSWGAAPQTITSGQYVQVRLDTPDSHNVTRTANLTVGQDTADWVATTPACDNTPDSFTGAFTDLTDQPKGTDTTSSIVQITGIEDHAECGGAVTLSGTAADEQFRICGSGDPSCASPGSWTTSATIKADEHLQLRMTTSSSHGTTLSAVPDIEGVTDTWQTTTCSATPDTFAAFTDLTDQPLSTQVTSDIAQVTGPANCTYATAVSGDASAEYRVCGDGTCSGGPAFTTAGDTLTAGEYVQARLTTSSSNAASVNATLDIEGVSDTFTATTCGDPGAFSFTDDTEQPLSTTVASDIVAVTGTAGCDFNVTVSGDASAEYRICDDGTCSGAPAWGSAAGVVAEGQYLQARVTTSGTKGATVNATLDVGSTPVSDTYSAMTKDDDPDAFDFTDEGSAPLSSTVTSDIVQITGITTNISTSISGDGSPEYRICDDSGCSTVDHTWASTSGSIDNGQYLQLRLTTPGTYSTLSTATMTVGLGSDDWNVTTRQAPKRVFVTAAGTYDGAFGGTGTADTDCQSAADAQSLGGTWKAWLSDSTTDASSRITQYSGDYELLDGTVVANGWSDLTDGSLDAAINRDETNSLQSGVTVYTGTGSGGAKVSATASDHCDDWTYNGNQGSRGGTYGSTSSTGTGWTNSGSAKCNNTRHLYCFEQ